ncbi:NmrA family NAD(P)-binding protein [Streptomyces sp. SL203]|nr:NmrA family NAD(P)-binding protein [Streptomyces sp. SL203]MCY1650523.1 NmrA family NAD(P)-binding protein [Streptomyces sp. SL203]
MTDRPLVLVTGATGAQGGSVARHLLRSGRWAVRAVTRDPRSAAAAALTARGADVVACDLTDPGQVRRSVAGVDAAFLVTDYWSLKEREYEVARRTADAVLAAGAGTLVHSSLPEAHRRSGGALALPHHDGKARLEEELRASGSPVVTVHLSTYYENWRRAGCADRRTARSRSRCPTGTPRCPPCPSPISARWSGRCSTRDPHSTGTWSRPWAICCRPPPTPPR